MAKTSEWQEANRRLQAEEREKIGESPTAEEMLAYSRGELSESDEERIRDFLAACPELVRMYAAPFPEAPKEGDPDAVSEEDLRAGWSALQRRLGRSRGTTDPRAEAQRGRVVVRRYVPTAIAAALAIVFFGLYVRAESLARYYEREGGLPLVLGAAQELEPDGSRGSAASTRLRNDGEGYLLRPRLIKRVRYPYYRLELRDDAGALLWTTSHAHPDEDDAFMICVPRELLRPAATYRLLVLGLDSETSTEIGVYRIAAPAQ